mmetsp:Transcript_13242/g.45809  ORF Transcript_13242/g.45809 Transcript_13242/m.45809 type:complete len:424 (-) Transcript_13242:1829-3100(-)
MTVLGRGCCEPPCGPRLSSRSPRPCEALVPGRCMPTGTVDGRVPPRLEASACPSRLAGLESGLRSSITRRWWMWVGLRPMTSRWLSSLRDGGMNTRLAIGGGLRSCRAKCCCLMRYTLWEGSVISTSTSSSASFALSTAPLSPPFPLGDHTSRTMSSTDVISSASVARHVSGSPRRHSSAPNAPTCVPRAPHTCTCVSEPAVTQKPSEPGYGTCSALAIAAVWARQCASSTISPPFRRQLPCSSSNSSEEMSHSFTQPMESPLRRSWSSPPSASTSTFSPGVWSKSCSRTRVPLRALHMRSMPSALAEARRLGTLRRNASASTELSRDARPCTTPEGSGRLVWILHRGAPLSMFHTTMTPSLLAVARLQGAWMAMARMSSPWAGDSWRCISTLLRSRSSQNVTLRLHPTPMTCLLWLWWPPMA